MNEIDPSFLKYNCAAIRLGIFDQLYENSKNQIYLTDVDYSLNQNEVNNFINNNKKGVYPLLHFIFKNITHVNFPTFIEKFKNYFIMCIKNKQNRENIKIKIVLIVKNLDLKKSNFWLALVIKDIILKNNDINVVIIDIMPSINDAFDVYKDKNTDNDIIFMIPDDCAYSGTQISTDLCIKDNLLEAINSSGIFVYPVIPYISRIAYKFTFPNVFQAQYKRSIFPSYLIFLESEIYFFKSFWELNIEENNNQFANDIIYIEKLKYKSYLLNYLYLQPKCCLIYFDHKIADATSTIQKLLVNPTVFSGEICTDFSILNDFRNTNCNDYNEIMKNYHNYFISINNLKNIVNKTKTKYNLLNNCNDDQNDFDNIGIYVDDYNDYKNICPETFYKTIEHMFNGKKILFLNQADVQDGGKYYKKYIQAKKEYLIFKNKIN